VLERVGVRGRVVGVDPNEGMLLVARRTPGIEWKIGSAEHLPLDGSSFDAVVSQFALMFFDDRRRAVSEIKRVLRPGGRAAVATWADIAHTPGYAAMADLLERLIGPEPAEALRAPYDLGNPAELHRLLSSDFENVEVTHVEGVARFDSVDAWVHTDIRGWTLADMSDAEHQILLEAARTELTRFTEPDGTVAFPAPALVAVATVEG
jgi:SAM-dependent methyltransferase